jgi:saccharopine dehydrogenase-like NADP-dependent oxidoreductase
MSAKNILLFGAGKSATVLIEYLINESVYSNWYITVADANLELIELKTLRRLNSKAVALDINDTPNRQALVKSSDIVISMMPPSLHILIAEDCIEFGKSLLTASYADEKILALESKVKEKGLLFLCEMGLDPGIDHMSAMELIDEIKHDGGEITSFKSHCGGLVAPECDDNPWHYKISWNPRNVVLAGKAGAIYKEDGKIIEEPYESLFKCDRTVSLENENNATFSYYPNRNSLNYIDLYELPNVQTFVRTTLRYPEFMSGWNNIVELQLTDETPCFDSEGKSLNDFFTSHFDKIGFNQWLDKKLSERFSETNHLFEKLEQSLKDEKYADNESATLLANKMEGVNLLLKQLFFLGIDDKETIINKGFCSAADVLQLALEKKLVLKETDKDMIVMLHEIEYINAGIKHSISSSLLVKGKDHLHTAMAQTVGLPLGIAAKFILDGTIKETGVQIPTKKEIYAPVLKELKNFGVAFKEKRC